MEKTFIGVVGRIGAGKSAVIEHLSDQFGVPYFYAGGAMRGLAEKEGYKSIEDFQKKIDETGGSFDKIVDDQLIEFIKNNNAGIIDARTGPHFMRKLLKREEYCIIFLDCELREGARRRLVGDLKKKNTDLAGIKSRDLAGRLSIKQKECKDREIAETLRFKKLYDYDMKREVTNADYYLNTTLLTQEMVCAKVVEIAHIFSNRNSMAGIVNIAEELVT